MMLNHIVLAEIALEISISTISITSIYLKNNATY